MTNPSRTWTIDFDNAYSNQLDQTVQYAETALAVKDTFIAAGWTVQRSGAGPGGFGAGDYWLSAADIYWNNNPTDPGGTTYRSWCVLRAPASFLAAGGALLEVLIDCNEDETNLTNPQDIDIRFSPTAYTDGTATFRPPNPAVQTTAYIGYEMFPFSALTTSRWTGWASTKGDVMFGVKEEGNSGVFDSLLMVMSNTDADGSGQGGHRWFAYADSGALTLASNSLGGATNWKGINAGASATLTPGAVSNAWTGASAWTTGLNYAGETIFAPIEVGVNTASDGRLYGVLVDVWGVPLNLPTATLDDGESLQAQRRYVVNDATLYIPTGSTFA